MHLLAPVYPARSACGTGQGPPGSFPGEWSSGTGSPRSGSSALTTRPSGQCTLKRGGPLASRTPAALRRGAPLQCLFVLVVSGLGGGEEPGRPALGLRLSFSLPTAVLKAEQAAVFKFPLAPLGCSGLSSALLAAGSGLQGASGPPHLPLELHLRGKLEQGVPDAGGKAKKGRRSRTVFTELQLMGLEKRFEKQKYLSTPDRWVRRGTVCSPPPPVWPLCSPCRPGSNTSSPGGSGQQGRGEGPPLPITQEPGTTHFPSF